MSESLTWGPIRDPAKLFDSQRQLYQQHRRGYPPGLFQLLQARSAPLLAAAAANIGASRPRIVDLACGTGQLTRQLKDCFPAADVIGIDASPSMVEAAKVAESELPDDQRPEYREGKAEALDITAASIDLVTVATGFHWFQRNAALREIARVLRPGGCFLAVNITEPRINAPFRLWWEEQNRTTWAAWRHPRLDKYFDLEDLVREPRLFELVARIDLPNKHTFTRFELLEWVATTSFGSQAQKAFGAAVFTSRILGEWSALLPQEEPFEVDFRVFGALQRLRGDL